MLLLDHSHVDVDDRMLLAQLSVTESHDRHVAVLLEADSSRSEKSVFR